jgi:hypothetical protein
LRLRLLLFNLESEGAVAHHGVRACRFGIVVCDALHESVPHGAQFHQTAHFAQMRLELEGRVAAATDTTGRRGHGGRNSELQARIGVERRHEDSRCISRHRFLIVLIFVVIVVAAVIIRRGRKLFDRHAQ